MAKIPNGILGPVFGRVGPVTGFLQNGEYMIKAFGKRKDRKITEKRTAQRQKLKLCNDFTKPFAGKKFFQKTFPAYGQGGTGYNRVTSSILNLAITGEYPDTHIAYPLVLISCGHLPAAVNATALAIPGGNTSFTWSDNSSTGTAKKEDIVILVAFFPDKNEIIINLNAGERKNGEAILDTSAMAGKTAETWIGFLSADEKDAANSVYTGSIVL